MLITVGPLCWAEWSADSVVGMPKPRRRPRRVSRARLWRRVARIRPELRGFGDARGRDRGQSGATVTSRPTVMAVRPVSVHRPVLVKVSRVSGRARAMRYIHPIAVAGSGSARVPGDRAGL